MPLGILFYPPTNFLGQEPPFPFFFSFVPPFPTAVKLADLFLELDKSFSVWGLCHSHLVSSSGGRRNRNNSFSLLQIFYFSKPDFNEPPPFSFASLRSRAILTRFGSIPGFSALFPRSRRFCRQAPSRVLRCNSERLSRAPFVSLTCR